MKFIKFLLLLGCGMALFISACSSSQDKAYKAQESIHEERLELVKQYQECIKKAEKDGTDKESCEQYLKASEALK
jgi:hypothetical protein